mgnify:CR=1 FL=1
MGISDFQLKHERGKKGGYMRLSGRARNISPSPTLAITAKAKRMKAEGIDVINFGAGEPDFDTPENVKEAAVAAIRAGFTKYTPASGTEELKDAVVAKLKRDNGLTYKREEVIISCGAKHSLYNLTQVLFEEGDEVLIPAPYWVTYPEQVKLAGAKPVFIPTKEQEGFVLRPEALMESLSPRTRALILNSPCNPTGAVVNRETLEEIASLAVEKGLCIISDECYEALIFDGAQHVSIASLSEEVKNNTIVVNAVSKPYSMTGWRIGYAAGPREVIKAMDDLQSQATSNPNSIAQKAAIEALLGSQEIVKAMVREFEKRNRYIVEHLNSIPGIYCFRPLGAFYVFPNISAYYGKAWGDRKILGSQDMATYLLEEARVAVVPGIDFGSDAHIRLSYATSMENITRGLDRIGEALARLS